MTLVNLPRATLCVGQDVFTTSTWSTAQGFCHSFVQNSQLCTYEQVRRACNNGGQTVTAGRWLRDRVGDDLALVTNGTDCNNFDGVVNAISGAGSQGGSYCCLEWPKY